MLFSFDLYFCDDLLLIVLSYMFDLSLSVSYRKTIVWLRLFFFVLNKAGSYCDNIIFTFKKSDFSESLIEKSYLPLLTALNLSK